MFTTHHTPSSPPPLGQNVSAAFCKEARGDCAEALSLYASIIADSSLSPGTAAVIFRTSVLLAHVGRFDEVGVYGNRAAWTCHDGFPIKLKSGADTGPNLEAVTANIAISAPVIFGKQLFHKKLRELSPCCTPRVFGLPEAFEKLNL